MDLKPFQYTTAAEKKAPDFKTKVYNYYTNNNGFGSARNKNYSELLMLYKAAYGKLDAKEVSYVLNPAGIDDPRLKNFPARMRNYDIISPIIQAFLGERSRMNYNYEVLVTNRDVANKYKSALNETFLGIVAQQAINALNDAGVDTKMESKPIPNIEELIKQGSKNYNDNRAIFGQEALDYIRYAENIDHKLQFAFEDYLTTGQCYTYKDVYLGGLNYEVVCPLELTTGHTSTGYIEDCDYVIRSNYRSLADAVDRYGRQLKQEDLNKLITLQNNAFGLNLDAFSIYINTERDTNDGNFIGGAGGMNDLINNSGKLLVETATFKTGIKTGLLRYTDLLGQPQSTIVDESYVLDTKNGDIDITWHWEHQVWSFTKLEEGIFTPIVPLAIQRNDINNTSICKQPYNGIRTITKTNEIVSTVKRGLVYQALTNIYRYNQEKMINRNRDKILLMPIGILPDEFGSDPFDFFNYYVDATGIAWFDESKPNALAVINGIKAVDLNLGTAIEQMERVISAVKSEWWELVGMNRQRYGESFASDGKAVTEQAIFRSSLLTAELFRRFDKFVETDFQGLLDYSKAAWIEGKTGSYINSDGKIALFALEDSLTHLESCYGVFVKDSAKEKEDLEAIKSIVPHFAQKGIVPASILANMQIANNKSKLLVLIEKSEEYEKMVEGNAQQQAEDAQRENSEMMAQLEKDKQEMLKYQIDVESDTEILVTKMKLEAQKLIAEMNMEEEPVEENNEESDKLDRDKFEFDKEIANRELELTNKKLAMDASMKSKELNFKEKQHEDNVKLKERDLVIKNKKKVTSSN